jgi:hypothetical protein
MRVKSLPCSLSKSSHCTTRLPVVAHSLTNLMPRGTNANQRRRPSRTGAPQRISLVT